ncbi:MAG: 1,4-alpha-glucan branching protein GlgB [Nitrospira sp.]|nr:1,4-alpha-glucan branching protein GlgB [Nitrospira sp.]
MGAPAEEIERLVRAEHWDPRAVLGLHPDGDQPGRMVVRAFLPEAAEATLLVDGHAISMTVVHREGLYEAPLPGKPSMAYHLRVTDRWGNVTERHDPYAFPPLLSDFDMHLFTEGTLYRAYEQLGAHLRTVESVGGVHFALWAPNARRVSVVGDFNGWDGRRHAMCSRGVSGLWELFVPDLPAGTLYKYEIHPRDGDTPFLKADPYAFAAELRPKTASVVCDLSTHQWCDQAWMEARSRRDLLAAPISIYEVHLGSWARVPEEGNRWLTYGELTAKLIPYVKDLGYTHIELMPVTEHPFDGSWGYQTTGYFAPTSRFGTPKEFMAFVDACHRADIGVIMDWAPSHFPDDPHGLASFDGTHLYDHHDPRLGYHPEWHSRIFNFGRVEVCNFLINSALFWLDRYHIDGLRVDAVASMLYLDYSRQPGEWIPNSVGGHENLAAIEFLKQLNIAVHREHPGVLTIAEESTAWPDVSHPTYTGGLGFSLKWNMGWMHDMLRYFSLDPVYRKHEHNHITFGLLYAFTENFVLVLSHDEVVHGKRALLDKMPGDLWQKFANLRALYGYMVGHPGKKMLFMGGEFGQWHEWNHDASLQWHLLDCDLHQGLQCWVRDLNWLYQQEPALHQVDFEGAGFQWIEFNDSEQSVVAFSRKARCEDESIVCACNFTPVPRYGYRIGVPMSGRYKELLNSDAAAYGGGNAGNLGGVDAEPVPWQGYPCSVVLMLPPLAVVFLKRQ